ncbi:MAG: adenine nucleotide alpha hydrolase [Bacteroidales bacterium]|nr:adenine nucleotide alpha hydrolase [Bacteroidales bacterium]
MEDDQSSQKGKAILSWSGGKDSMMSLHEARRQGYDVKRIFTTLIQEDRVSMHGIHKNMIRTQADLLDLELVEIDLPEMPPPGLYNEKIKETLTEAYEDGYEYALYGDIHLEDLKSFREKITESTGLKAGFPIWQYGNKNLVTSFIELGYKAMVICVSHRHLDPNYLGRIIDYDFLEDLPPHLDPNGENGEYHSFVFSGPLFEEEIRLLKGEFFEKDYSHIVDPNSNIDTRFWCLDIHTEENA